MKSVFLLFLLAFPIIGLSQKPPPRFQMGFTTGNLLTVTQRSTSEVAQGGLIRYQAGLLFRSTLAEKINLPRPFPKIKKGMVAFDYGLNVQAKGFHYSLEQFEQTKDHWAFEIPLLLTLYDRNDMWMSRKHRRKGFATFARFGPKLVWEIPAFSDGVLTNENFKLAEKGKQGGLNFIWSVGGGILQHTKKGNSFSFHIAGNIGFWLVDNIVLEYSDEIGVIDNFEIRNNGSYLESTLIYLFDPRNIFKGKGVPPPVIFNPRF